MSVVGAAPERRLVVEVQTILLNAVLPFGGGASAAFDRLAFLGMGVLSRVMTQHLYDTLPAETGASLLLLLERLLHDDTCRQVGKELELHKSTELSALLPALDAGTAVKAVLGALSRFPDGSTTCTAFISKCWGSRMHGASAAKTPSRVPTYDELPPTNPMRSVDIGEGHSPVSAASPSLLRPATLVDHVVPSPRVLHNAGTGASRTSSVGDIPETLTREKVTLQEWTQAHALATPSYTFERVGGDHNPIFTATVTIPGFPAATNQGEGLTKKQAEEEAAAAVLRTIRTGVIVPPPGHRIGSNGGGVGIGIASAAPRPEDPASRAKSTLLEWTQKNKLPTPEYSVCSSGPPHAPEFVATVKVSGLPDLFASSTTKKLAEC